MNIYDAVLPAVQAFVSLKRYEDSVSYSVSFKYYFCRGEFGYLPFDVVYHVL